MEGDAARDADQTDAGNLDRDASVTHEDAGSEQDAAVTTDAGSTADASAEEPGCLGDFEPVACVDDAECGAQNKSCLRGACVHTCGETAANLDDDLGAPLEVLGGFCAARYEQAEARVTTEAGCETASAYYLSGGNVGDDGYDWLLWEQALDPHLQAPPRTEHMGGTVVRSGSGTQSSQGALRLSRDGQDAYFVISDGATMQGELYRQRVGMMGAEEVVDGMGPLTRFDWLDDGRLLMPGARQEGGSYTFSLDAVPVDDPSARKAVVEAGSVGFFSVAVLEDAGVVMLGVGAASEGVYVIALADLVAAYDDGTPIPLMGDARFTHFDLDPEFRVIGDELWLHTDYTQSPASTVARRIDVTDGAVTFGEPFELMGGGTYLDVVGLGGGRLMFTHFSGTVYARLSFE